MSRCHRRTGSPRLGIEPERRVPARTPHRPRGPESRPIARREAMNLSLWIGAGLLAAVALAGGISKTFVPKAKLAEAPGGEWTAAASVGFVKTLGVLELLAAVGLTLP